MTIRKLINRSILAVLPLVTSAGFASQALSQEIGLDDKLPPVELPLCIPNVSLNPKEVAAVLDGQVITLEDIDREMLRRPYYAPLAERVNENPILLSALRARVLEGLVGVKLLNKAAIKADVVDKNELKNRLNQVVRAVETSPERLQNLENAGVDLEFFKKELEEDLRVELYLDKLYKDVTVDESEVLAAYDRARKDSLRHAQLRASIILVAVAGDANPLEEASASARAALLRRQAMDPGQSFSELAFANSDHKTSQVGGYLGPTGFGVHGEEFDRVVEQLEVGDISEPVRTGAGYLIIKLHEKTTPAMEPFELAKPKIENTIKREKKFAIMERKVSSLARTAKLDVRLFGFKLGE